MINFDLSPTDSMHTVTPEKLERLEKHLMDLLAELKRHNHLHIHQAINEFYYLQKTEELRILRKKLSEGISDFDLMMEKIGKHYEEVFCKWRTDCQWMKNHVNVSRGPVGL